MGLNKTRCFMDAYRFLFSSSAISCLCCLFASMVKEISDAPLCWPCCCCKRKGCIEGGKANVHPWVQHRSGLWNLLTCRKHSTRLAHTKKRAPMLCSYQYGSIASKSRVSARVNKTQCLPSCHSLLQGASSEPTVKGNATAAGSCCYMALHSDCTVKRNIMKQKTVFLSKKKRMCFQCSDASFSWKFYFPSESWTQFWVWLGGPLGQVFLHALVIPQESSFPSPPGRAEPFSSQ